MTATPIVSHIRGLLILAIASSSGWAGIAAAQDRPLKESEVTESALIEALAPREVDGAEDFSRGFRPAVRPTPRRQSILMTFETDSAALLQRTRDMLDIVAGALRSDRLAHLSVTIEGHADPRGDEVHNRRLSQARAESVVGYLVSRHGIEAARLHPVGKGSAEVLNRADPAAAENRRVSIIAVPQ